MKSADGRFEFLDLDYEDCPEGEAPARFGFKCPNNPRGGMCSGLLIRGAANPGSAAGGSPSWIWDGNVQAPTFSPSINCERCWHGFIERGVLLNTAKQPEPNQG